MKIGVPKETLAGEHRVALIPGAVKRLVAAEHEVLVQEGAGAGAGFPDEAFREAGATVVAGPGDVVGAADVILKVQPPAPGDVASYRSGAALIALLRPGRSEELYAALAQRQVTAFAMELVPRTTLAQSMDVLSSQATVAGYKAVLLGAATLGKLLPMLTTAAGTLAPAKVFILGAGVAGLQAIATARRLGAIVSAFDVRPVVREQVESLGATFIEAETVEGAEGSGGYAKELAAEQQEKILAAVGGHVSGMDVVITTAQIPGKPAPLLITEDMVKSMPAGAVIVDLAAETGGNCALTQLDETVTAHGVTILGPGNLPATVPFHASQMYSKNLTTFLDHLTQDGALAIDLEDAITGPMCVVADGAVRFGSAS